MHLSTFNPPAFLFDPYLIYLLYFSILELAPEHVFVILFFHGLFLLFTKTVKLFPHFYTHPADLVFLPAHLSFGYLHGLIKIYALLTLWKTEWERRAEPHVAEEDRPMIQSPGELTMAEKIIEDTQEGDYFGSKH